MRVDGEITITSGLRLEERLILSPTSYYCMTLCFFGEGLSGFCCGLRKLLC